MYLKFKYLLFINCLVFTNLMGQRVFINEIQSSNGNTVKDEQGFFEDWFELYNDEDTSVNLLNWYISDNNKLIDKWQFPSISIAPKGFLLVFASGKDRKQGVFLHTNFSISAAGEPLILSYPNKTIADSIRSISIPRDQSYGRQPDGSDSFYFFNKPTPGKSNNLQSSADASFSLTSNYPSGFYTQSFFLKFMDSLPTGALIYYTKNGKDPYIYDEYIEDSLLIEDDQFPNTISLIRTNPEDAPLEWTWRPPLENIKKIQTLKARAYIGDSAISGITHLSYIMDKKGHNRYSLPVVSLQIEPKHFFDYDSGIYVHGADHDKDPSWFWYWGAGNYYRTGADWEKPAHFLLLDQTGERVVEREVGVRLNGKASRALPQKSLRLYARADGVGGKGFNYSFFPYRDFAAYERILLRNAGQDFDKTLIRDAFTQELIKPLDIEAQDYQAAIVFINGEYWGLQFFRDRIDTKFLAYRKGVDPDNLDWISYANEIIVEEGTYDTYRLQVRDYINKHIQDLNAPEVYQHLSSQIDLTNFIDYTISKLYLGVYDWPGNNQAFWRERAAGGKFRWISFDNDDAFFDPYYNALKAATDSGNRFWPNPDYSTHLLRNLLKIERFKDSFLQRFERHLNGVLNYKRVDSMWVAMCNEIKGEVKEHSKRWQYPSDYGKWERETERIRLNIAERHCYLRDMISDYFDIQDPEYWSHICQQTQTPKLKEEQNIHLYPNPNTGIITLRINPKSYDYNQAIVHIQDLQGRTIQLQKVSQFHSPILHEYEIDLKHVEAGIYLVSIYDSKQKETHRVIRIKE